MLVGAAFVSARLQDGRLLFWRQKDKGRALSSSIVYASKFFER